MSSRKSDSSSKAVVPVEDSALALLDSADLATAPTKEFVAEHADTEGAGLAHLDARDVLVVPQLTVSQGGSRQVKDGRCRPAYFWDIGTETVLEPPITVVPLLTFKTRVRWPGPGDNRMIPICKSNNNKNGIGTPGGDCTKCALRRSWDDAAHKFEGECDEQYSFIFYVFGHVTPVLMHFKRKSIPVGRQIIKLLAVPPRVKPYCLAFRLNTREEQAGSHTFFNPFLDRFPQNNDKRLPLLDARFKPLLAEFKALHEQYDELFRGGSLLPAFEREDSNGAEAPIAPAASPEDVRAAIEGQAVETDEACPF